MTESEKYIAELNSSFFFKEFTYSSTKFKFDEKGQELELADNVVWLDNLLLISQIKERNDSGNSNIENWFKNKVLRKAVKQIKDTISYFEIYKEISIPNEKGHILNVSEARKLEPIKLIIYAPNHQFPETLRFQKFYKSKEIGNVHLFHIEDYLWICKYLITPFEIKEYLDFRELLFLNNEKELNNLPEQYVLGHYLETLDTSMLNPKYVGNLKNLVHDKDEFDISFIIDNFKEKIRIEPDSLDYYAIIRELAKLTRTDLREFKKRYLLAIEKSKTQEFTLPYRITSLNSQCGFVFIPLEYERSEYWQNVIINFTEANKYDQKINKCIGMIVYQHPTEKYFDVNWYYSESEWEHNEEFEKLLRANYPFRTVKIEKTYRYYIDENKNV
ncbi:hypothetical protein KZP23_04815 [Echinicola marina]|uniref:hypothetical protein n=1 Tax=Echinicola marina TaxID=2859768 RepID=UPI001CF6D5D1|nr:hypothetical protein [Echinicola marina]UCS94355.1 hypothetical protein KZP23_04815 [Echinicola marina]